MPNFPDNSRPIQAQEKNSSQSSLATTPSTTMKLKQLGNCPFCLKSVRPRVVEKGNFLRREKCECPECSHTIYQCRALGCTDYAKATDNYANELCLSHQALWKTLRFSFLSVVGAAVATYVKSVASEAGKSHGKSISKNRANNQRTRGRSQ